MKEIWKNGAFLFLRLLIVVVMCLIVTVSISVLTIAAFTKNVGYTAFVTDSEGNEIDEYYFNTDDGEDAKLEEYSSKGYTVNKVTKRSELKGKGAVVYNVTSQVISLIILTVFVYNKLFPMGNSDGNLVRFGHKKEDKLLGLKIGLVAIIPSILIFIASVIFALGANPDMTVSFYTFPNFYVFQILRAIIGSKIALGDLSVWQFALMFISLSVVPIISHLSYILGYKDILIVEKITYKKKK